MILKRRFTYCTDEEYGNLGWKPEGMPVVNAFEAKMHRDTSEYHDGADILEVYDMESGKLIIEVGTANVDDYYPGFVASWKPENLYFNEGESK